MPRGLFFCVVVFLGGSTAGCGAPSASDDLARSDRLLEGRNPSAGPNDDVLRVAVAREPTTWNRLLATELVTHVVTDQIHEPLIRLNQETQRMEPALAESWAFSDDGTELVFRLRDGVRFSDGEPFTAADVVFTFRALHDPAVASPLVDTAEIDGTPLVPVALDDRTVCFALPARTAAIERVFDSIRILPQHLLSESVERGTLAEDTGLGAPLANVVGLGPFRLKEHLRGQRVVLEKNPHYYRAAEGLPRLRGIVFDIVPDPAAQLLKLRAGEVDLLEFPIPLPPEIFRALARADSENLVVKDLGPGMVSERLWFNLNPRSPIDAAKKRWFGDVRFRRAISLAIDREDMARVVFDGLASPAAGSVSLANHFWRDETVTTVKRDLEQSHRLLDDAGFHREGGALHDEHGNRVRFTIVTNAGNDARKREGAFLQQDLEQIGIETTLVPIEGSALLAKITHTFDYDACLLGFTATDPDPSAEMALWMSSAPLHLWHPAQSKPATEWEARIDLLMKKQMMQIDRDQRRATFHEVQRIVAEQLPVLHLVVPHALIAHHPRLKGTRANPFSHTLWNREELYLDNETKKTPIRESVISVTDSPPVGE